MFIKRSKEGGLGLQKGKTFKREFLIFLENGTRPVPLPFEGRFFCWTASQLKRKGAKGYFWGTFPPPMMMMPLPTSSIHLPGPFPDPALPISWAAADCKKRIFSAGNKRRQLERGAAIGKARPLDRALPQPFGDNPGLACQSLPDRYDSFV